MKNDIEFLIALFLLLCPFGNKVSAQETIIYAKDTLENGDFGLGIGSYNDLIIVGDIEGNPDFSPGGAAYIFKKEGEDWVEKAKLLQASGFFGWSVDIHGDYAVVGAFQGHLGIGAAYIFKKEGEDWVEDAILLASDGDEGDRFGSSVSIYENYVAIGSPGDSDEGIAIGSVYIFKRTGNSWEEMLKISPDDGTNSDNFGHSLNLEMNHLVIGTAVSPPNNSGKVYLYKKTNELWEYNTQLIPPNDPEYDYFGSKVDISENKIIISTRYQSTDMEHSLGAAFIFQNDGLEWVQDALLLPFDNTTEDDFYSWSVAIDDDLAAFSLPGEHNSGRIFVFQKNGDNWDEKTIITPSNGNDYDQFSKDIVIENNYLVTGAFNNTSSSIHGGAGYIYDLDLILSNYSVFEKLGIELFPNPTKGEVNIRTEKNVLIQEISVYDLQGNLVLHSNSGEGTINLTFLLSGVYLVKLDTNKGILTKKILLNNR